MSNYKLSSIPIVKKLNLEFGKPDFISNAINVIAYKKFIGYVQ